MLTKMFFSIICICAGMLPFAIGAQTTSLLISNTTPVQRTDELIVLQRSTIQQKLGKAAFISASANGKAITVQHDDINGDGRWDEAVFLLALSPNSSQLITLKTAATNNQQGATQRAHVRLRKKNADDTFGPYLTHETMPLRHINTDFSKQPLPLYLAEGPAWENDKIAFRLYFDIRNGKDIFGKRTSTMMMDTVGAKPKSNYHQLSNWGMDILHAGKSLGSGALALLVPTSTKDTLIRLGGDQVTNTVYQQLADGPVRAVFTITYDWLVMGKPMRIVEQTSIWGGQYFYEDKLTVTGAPKNALLVAGIASFYNNTFQSFNQGKCGVIFSYGNQSENKDALGMAIVVPNNNLAFTGSTPNQASEILNTYISAQHINSSSPCRFRFYGGWEVTDPLFASASYFKTMLNNEVVKMDTPVIIQFK